MTHRAQPLYFGDAAGGLFGWLHLPERHRARSSGNATAPLASAPAPRGLGLVLCNPFGYESICTHRLYRQMARESADAGLPSLRFDYYGTGDSAGDELEGDQLVRWLASIDQAIEALCHYGGVTQIALCGVRLGALLALHAAHRNPRIVAVAAIAPILSGRQYLRELRALAQASPLSAPVRAGSHGDDPEAAQPHSLEVAGYRINEATRAALAKLDVAKTNLGHDSGQADWLRPCPIHILAMERDDLPSDGAWSARLESGGALVRRQPIREFSSLMRDPHEAQIPTGLIATLRTWLLSLPAESAAGVAGAADGARGPLTPRSMPVAADLWEHAVEILGTTPLFGIYTQARSPGVHCGGVPALRHGAPCLLLINSGAVHHVGPSRLYVELARQLAASGLTVLRLDLEGLGDSSSRLNEPDNVVYMPGAFDNLQQAIAFVQKTIAPNKLYCSGICSGAYHSFKAAAQNLALDGVLPINPLVYFWDSGMPPNTQLDLAPHLAAAEAQRVRRSALRLTSWRKLLQGDVALGHILRAYGYRAASLLGDRFRSVLRLLGVPLKNDLAQELKSATARNTTLQFIFAKSDPGLLMLREQAGRTVTRLERAGALRIEVIDGADHTFTPRSSRQRLIEVMRAGLPLSTTTQAGE